MFEKTLEPVIGLDPDGGMIHLYTMEKGQRQVFHSLLGSCRAKPFSEEYFVKLGSVLAQYRQNHPHRALQQVTVVLPDWAVMTDTVHLPALHKRAMASSLAASLRNLYGNGEDLHFNHAPVLQNKQAVTFAVTAVRKDLLAKLRQVFGEHQITVSRVTYAAAVAAGGAMTLEPRLKNGSFLLLELQEDRANIVFVAKGRTLGYYTLPFGSGILSKTQVIPEERLFDHSAAELVVRNAMEKAQAKVLSVAAEEPEHRRLPDFMLRPTPSDEAEFVYENFRVFVKWTLELLAANTGITALGAPEAVYVHLPREYAFVCDLVNREEAENGIRFLPLVSDADCDLTLYGGQINKLNCFRLSQRRSKGEHGL